MLTPELACGACGGDGVIMVKPSVAGRSDDLAEYEPCPACADRKQAARLRQIISEGYPSVRQAEGGGE